MKKFLLIFSFTICTSFLACTNFFYYRKVSDNTRDFEQTVSYIQKKGLLKAMDSLKLRNDSLFVDSNKCIYEGEKQDSFITSFMKRYNLDRICFYRTKISHYDSLFTFHKSHNPIFGRAITVNYCFMKSSLREKIKGGEENKNKNVLPVNDGYLYIYNSKHSFGQ